uniref:PTC1-like winged helix-turn-helix domain-containing protein n=1 Tax=Leersia perrieri TaxID=77586 RepID=A0A0D9VWY8_9ORYZ
MDAAEMAVAAHLLDSPMCSEVSLYYSKKRASSSNRNGKDDANHDESKNQTPGSPLSRQSLSSSATHTYHTGGFYEIDHEKLPPKSPIHLKSIRVVKVSGYTSLDVTVSFPSLLSLRSFFSSSPRPRTGCPELDERFVMSSNHAARILRRRVAEEELAGGEVMHQDSFWLVKPCLYDFSASTSSPHDALQLTPSSPPAPPAAACLLDTLKCDGAGWGVRRRVRYIGRHQHDVNYKEASLDLDDHDTEVSVQEEVQQQQRQRPRRTSQEDSKRKREEEAEDRRRRGRDAAARKKKKAKTHRSPKKRVVEAKDGDPRRGKERWSAERYAAAERSLLDIMRARGARFGAPVMRPALREEARKHIGDTGLLDHLLKHMAGRVPEGCADRFRRRHNADGAMEYWLEPAELAEVRRQAGVSDPYWVPPPGWKPGDDVSSVAGDLLVKKKVEELAEEVDGVKRGIEQLSSNLVQLGKETKSEAERSYSSRKEKYQKLVKANEKLEKQVISMKDMYEKLVQKRGKLKKEVLSLKDKYKLVLEKNDKLEEQMANLSSSFLSLKEQLLLPENGDNLNMDRERVEVTVGKQETVVPGKPLYADGGDQTSQQADATVVQVGEKRTARKSGFRICKPQGTFLWPNMASGTSMAISGGASSSCPIDAGREKKLPRSNSFPGILPPDERAVFRGGFNTPPSASSTNAAKLPPLPSPTSPLQTRALFSAGFTVPPLHNFSGLALRHVDSPSPSSAPCGAREKMAMFDGDGRGINTVGTELALATPSYC